jgi:hypothetical protein
MLKSTTTSSVTIDGQPRGEAPTAPVRRCGLDGADGNRLRAADGRQDAGVDDRRAPKGISGVALESVFRDQGRRRRGGEAVGRDAWIARQIGPRNDGDLVRRAAATPPAAHRWCGSPPPHRPRARRPPASGRRAGSSREIPREDYRTPSDRRLTRAVHDTRPNVRRHPVAAAHRREGVPTTQVEAWPRRDPADR